MNIIIRADRKIGNELIAEHIFSGKRIIDRFIDLGTNLKANVLIVSGKKIEANKAKAIPSSKVDNIKSALILDLNNIYDQRKLEKLLKKGKDPRKAIIKENRTLADLNSFGCLFCRKEWNPLSQYYVEPLGEKLAFALRKSGITPNQVTLFNILLGLLASLLIFMNTALSLIIFGIFVRFFHMLDIADGHLARLKNKLSLFGKWIDGGGDKFVMMIWYSVIALTLFLKRNDVIYIIAGFALLVGAFVYNYLLLTSVAYFRSYNKDYTIEEGTGKKIVSKALMFFINYDMQLHIFTVFALLNKIEYILFFYAAYFNFAWLAYFVYYFTKYIKEGDVRES